MPKKREDKNFPLLLPKEQKQGKEMPDLRFPHRYPSGTEHFFSDFRYAFFSFAAGRTINRLINSAMTYRTTVAYSTY